MGTFSIWHWLVVLLFIVAPVAVGAWTGWKRHITQKTYAIIFCGLLAVGIIGEITIEAIGQAGVVVVLVTSPIIVFMFVHTIVRRLNSVDWPKWPACIPFINGMVGIVLLFKRTPEPVKARKEPPPPG